MTLLADEFIRRFLLHVLPNGLQRIRYCTFEWNGGPDVSIWHPGGSPS